jgi:hypothetical protein
MKVRILSSASLLLFFRGRGSRVEHLFARQETRVRVSPTALFRGCGPAWSGRRPVTPEIAGSNPASLARGFFCEMAQLAAHLTLNQGVSGSNPDLAALRGRSPIGRGIRLRHGGWRFESSRPYSHSRDRGLTGKGARLKSVTMGVRIPPVLLDEHSRRDVAQRKSAGVTYRWLGVRVPPSRLRVSHGMWLSPVKSARFGSERSEVQILPSRLGTLGS